ncbi:hypothetical protein KHA94_16430 [Bacillus sp. FJAT-49705]|uniref:Uncharacterized protein n=1 Tax=Cytobacillus citreus TaxID=2833586 RepID=A0ABS5NX95_9BACI|nr:hypothetical protein [Cytobacillus citreus]MBS4191778.1 hypothetical protein [Cytobacillus citreus]
MLNNQSKVVIPLRILEQEKHLSNCDFFKLVEEYLRKYQNYMLVRIEDGLAVCERGGQNG